MFSIDIFETKWPKSEEKLEFGVGSFLWWRPCPPPNLKIVPTPLVRSFGLDALIIERFDVLFSSKRVVEGSASASKEASSVLSRGGR